MALNLIKLALLAGLTMLTFGVFRTGRARHAPGTVKRFRGAVKNPEKGGFDAHSGFGDVDNRGGFDGNAGSAQTYDPKYPVCLQFTRVLWIITSSAPTLRLHSATCRLRAAPHPASSTRITRARKLARGDEPVKHAATIKARTNCHTGLRGGARSAAAKLGWIVVTRGLVLEDRRKAWVHRLAGTGDDMPRFGVMHFCGVGRGTEGDQKT